MFEQTITRALSRLGLAQRGTDPYPRQPLPVLLRRAEEMFASPDWVCEPKSGGFREHVPMRPTTLAYKLPS
jgi:hypothetical protein